MKRTAKIFLFCLLVCFAFGLNTDAATPLRKRIDRKRFQTKEWNDGKAEVSLYRAREILMRKARASNVVIIFEKRLQNVSRNEEEGKTASKGRATIVMSLLRKTDFGVSTIHSNCMVEALMPKLLFNRVTLSQQQWGEVSLRMLDFQLESGAKGVGRFYDFFRIQKRSSEHLFDLGSLADGISYEALPLLLRAIDFEKGDFDFLLIEPLENRAIQEPRMGPAEVKIAPEEKLVITGHTYQVRPVVVSHFLGEDRFWFEPKAPYLLIKWVRYSGAEYTFRKSERLDYWNKTKPMDSTLLY